MNISDKVKDIGEVPFRHVPFFSSDVILEEAGDSVMIMRSAEPLGHYSGKVGEWLDRWAEIEPHRKFIVEQSADGEMSVTYRQARDRVLLLAERLLNFPLSAEHPIVIVAENSIKCALMMLAGLYVGIPVAPVAPAYVLQSKDYAKLKDVFSLLTPGLVVVDEGEAYQQAVLQAVPLSVPVVALHKPIAGILDFDGFDADGLQVESVITAAQAVSPETIAKFLFTSGSTGAPKAVINTHRMLCAGAQQQRQISPSIGDEPPTMVDWLPWNHTAGGNSNFNIILYNGGTLYIDPGKPTVEHISKTVSLLKRVSPTLYFNVPMGYDALLPYLENDDQLRRNFFCNLKFLWYAAASMQPSTWAALERLAVETVGERILIVTGLGMTETCPVALFGNKRANGPGVVGIPAPGVEMKLVHCGNGHWAAGYKGPNVTAGYWRNPEATSEAFDEDGYFISGDLVSFVNPEEPAAGLKFEGRQSEDFKLSSGTRVAAGALRLKVLARMSSLVNDVVIMGDGRADVRILVYPDWKACAASAGVSESDSPGELARNPKLKSMFREIISDLAASGTGGSNRVVAAMLVDIPLSAFEGEVTQKGTINRRVLQRNRPELVEALYENTADARVITVC